MERRDLLAKNVEIIRAHAGALGEVGSPDVKVVVVANPANTLALVAIKAAPLIPARNFTALTRLDQDRLRCAPPRGSRGLARVTRDPCAATTGDPGKLHTCDGRDVPVFTIYEGGWGMP
jgi:hypothetical protein